MARLYNVVYSWSSAVTGRSAIARLKLKIQLYCGSEIAMGPGKAALLRAIAETGSISAAGRALGMSYRRAWLLVDTMNRCFADPLVETTAGAGARVTAAGKAALADYLALAVQVEGAAAGTAFERLEGAIRREPGANSSPVRGGGSRESG